MTTSYKRLDKDNAAVLLVDHQAGLLSLVRDIEPDRFKNNVLALADLAKYVRRGSVWEALDRLHEARTQLWRLHAAASGIADPQYGLTSVLDFAPEDIPAGIEETVAGLSLPSLLAAARQAARLLTATGQRLPAEAQAALPQAMARYVAQLLDSIEV